MALLLSGQFVSLVGSSVYWVAIMLLLKEMTGSGAMMGLVETLALLPAFLLGPLAGTVVDMLDRRKIIVGADLVSGVTMILLALPAAIQAVGVDSVTWAGVRVELSGLEIQVWMVFAATVIVSFAQALFRPAVDAAVPDLVPDGRLKRVNALFQSNFYLTYLIGTSIAGLLYGTVGAALLILGNGISYLIAAGLETFLTIPRRGDRQAPSGPRVWMSRTREGLVYLWQHGGLRGMVLSFAVTNALFPPMVLSLPFFVERDLGLPVNTFGYVLAAYLAGGIVGFLRFGAIGLSGRQNALVFHGTFFVCAALIGVVAVISWVPGVYLLFALVSVNVAIINLMAQTIVQRVVPSSLRGRVFGSINAVTTGLMPVSYALSGLIIDAVGQQARWIFGGVAGVCFLVAVWLVGNRSVRQLVVSWTAP